MLPIPLRARWTPRRLHAALRAAPLVALLLALASPAPAEPAEREPASDAYLRGYATAVVERELGPTDASVTVRAGAVHVRAPGLGPEERAALEAALGEVEGVRSVRVTDEAPVGPVAAEASEPEESGVEILPERELFAPLLADPRWPHFAAAVQGYLGDEELGTVAGVSFGEHIPLLGGDGPLDGRWQLALQAGVFSIFDLESESFDLLNSDFMAGFAATWRRGPLAGMLRLFHQSSHLGDELLLRERVDRVNLSYEQLDALVSYELGHGLRAYGGGGVIVHADPASLDRPSLQLGLEWQSPRTWWEGALRPLAAVDVKSWAETGWEADLSARAGFEVESFPLSGRRLQLLLEYYDGRSPNGQFFERDVRWLGLGTHLHF